MGLLDGKRILVTGVLTNASIAFAVAELAQQEGAELILTGAGRGRSLTGRTARRLDDAVEVLEFDATEDDHVPRLQAELADRWDTIDGALHAIGFAPEICLGGDIMAASWEDVALALQISTYSLKSLAEIVRPSMPDGGSIVGLDFDASHAWPSYDWMGVAKAALESTNRYLARDLGSERIRCNLVAAGPIRSMAAKSIPGFEQFEDGWSSRAPLGWDVRDASAVAQACVALLSDWFPATTGEIVHVDGGYHAMGA